MIGTLLYTLLFCKNIGCDEKGNKYYVSRLKSAEGKYIRSISYNGSPEPTKIPPMYHAWLHYQTDDFPHSIHKQPWQIVRKPNLTGTSQAYKPSWQKTGYKSKQTKSGDYQPWRPQE